MEVIDVWTGQRACALQTALRMSNETFAGHLGIGVRTVASWHDSPDLSPRPDIQQLLDIALEKAPQSTKSRLGLLLGQIDAEENRGYPQSMRIVVPEPRESLDGHAASQHGDEITRRVLLGQSVAGEPLLNLSLLSTAEAVRREMEDTLAAGTLTFSRLDRIEETVASHIRVYTTTPPAAALAGLLLDFMDVRKLCAERQPAMIQARLSEIAAFLAILAADSLMKLGRIGEARAWYGTACIAADDSGNRELRARVRAQEAMLPYYYGNSADVIRLVREAQALLEHVPRAAGALAYAAEARALSRLGAASEATAAIARAQELVEMIHEPDGNDAFRFGERRLLFYMSSTFSNIGETARAHRIQEQALKNYEPSAPLLDPVLIRLDQAQLLAHEGNAAEAVSLSREACLCLGVEHRTPIIAARVRHLVEQLAPLNVTASQELADFRQAVLLASPERISRDR